MASEEKGRDFAALLNEMPRIAEVVNAFSDEAVQKQAFEALVGAFYEDGTPGTPTPTGESNESEKTRQKRRTRKPKAGDEVGKKSRPRSTSPTVLRDLDLAPKGKKSFKAFVEEKQPKTQHDKNVISVYYLTEIAKGGPVTTSHVFTCYRDMPDWRVPANVANSLALTTNRKRFLDTSDMQNITVTPTGMNHVEHDLPPKKKGD
jgi:hypothetical protein